MSRIFHELFLENDRENIYQGLCEVLGITDLYNNIILFTLSVCSRDFAFSFTKMSHTNRDNVSYL